MRLFLIFPLLFITFSVNAKQLITFGAGRVGEISIGMQEKELYKDKSAKIKKIDIKKETEESTLLYTFRDGPSAILELNDGKVDRILIRDARIKSGKNIGVGSKFTDVVKNYPDAKLYFSRADGSYVTLLSKKISASFTFDTKDVDFEKLSTIYTDINAVVKELGEIHVIEIIVFKL